MFTPSEFIERPKRVQAFYFDESRALHLFKGGTLPFDIRGVSGSWYQATEKVTKARVHLMPRASKFSLIDYQAPQYWAELGDWIVQHPHGTLEAVKPEQFFIRYTRP